MRKLLGTKTEIKKNKDEQTGKNKNEKKGKSIFSLSRDPKKRMLKILKKGNPEKLGVLVDRYPLTPLLPFIYSDNQDDLYEASSYLFEFYLRTKMFDHLDELLNRLGGSAGKEFVIKATVHALQTSENSLIQMLIHNPCEDISKIANKVIYYYTVENNIYTVSEKIKLSVLLFLGKTDIIQEFDPSITKDIKLHLNSLDEELKIKAVELLIGIYLNKQDWESIEKLWHYAFFDRLHVNPNYNPIMMVESFYSTREQQEKIAEIMFEVFCVPQLLLSKSPLLCLYAAGKITGVIVTRMDSSARGGGAITACAEVKAGVFFITTGEKIPDIEPFNPSSFISRIIFKTSSKRPFSIFAFTSSVKRWPRTISRSFFSTYFR